jgi:hypothetical protein
VLPSKLSSSTASRDEGAAATASHAVWSNGRGPPILPGSSIPQLVARYMEAHRTRHVVEEAAGAISTSNGSATEAFERDLVAALASMDADVAGQAQNVTRWVGGGAHVMYPITFGIPSQYVRAVVPAKSKGLATVVPGEPSTYKFWPRPGATPADLGSLEQAYYADMEQSLFGLTWKKAGWDCLRHLELLAAGCVPLFTDIHAAPPGVLALYPKRVLKLALRFPGVTALQGVPGQPPVARGGKLPLRNVTIDMAALDKGLYGLTVAALLDYTRRRLTTAGVAAHLLGVMGVDPPYCGLGAWEDGSTGAVQSVASCHPSSARTWRRSRLLPGFTRKVHDVMPLTGEAASVTASPALCRPLRVLFLAMAKQTNDYMTDMLVHGLSALLGPAQVTQHHRRDVLYTTPDLLFEDKRAPFRSSQYGMGFSYGNTLYDPVDAADEIEAAARPDTLTRLRADIAALAFDIVVLGLIHRGRPPLMEEVCAAYPRIRVAAVHGHDFPPTNEDLLQYGRCAGFFFAREAV